MEEFVSFEVATSRQAKESDELEELDKFDTLVLKQDEASE
jgi:hypothetical protein